MSVARARGGRGAQTRRAPKVKPRRAPEACGTPEAEANAPLPDLWRGSTFSRACAAGDLKTAAELLERHREQWASASSAVARSLARECFFDACAAGNFTVARWLAEALSLTPGGLQEHDSYALHCACRSGNLELVIWLVRSFGLGVNDPHAARGALRTTCAAGHVNVAAWLARSFQLGADDAHEALRGACAAGHESAVRWLVGAFRPRGAAVGAAFGCACVAGHLGIARWLAAVFQYGAGDVGADVMLGACTNGQFAVAQWLVEVYGAAVCGAKTAAIRDAIASHEKTATADWLMTALVNQA
jgi:hypothetical protein